MNNDPITFRPDEVTPEQIERIREYLERYNPGIKINQSDAIKYAITMADIRIKEEQTERAAQ